MRALALLALLAVPALGEDPPELRPPAPPRPFERLRPQPFPRPAPGAGGASLPSPDLESLGLSERNQAILRELAARLQRGERVDPVQYFTALLNLDDSRLHDLVHALQRMAAAGGPPSPQLRSRLYGEYLRAHPRSHRGFAGLAESRAEQGDFGNAVAAYTRAIGLGGADADAFFGRGAAAEELGDHEFANRDAQQALALQPENPQAQALAKLTQGRPSKVRIDPATGEAQAVGPAGGERGPEDFLAQLPWESERGPTQPGAAQLSADMSQAAQRFLQLSDARSAIQAAAKAAQLDPRSAKAHNLLAAAHARAGNYAESLAAADRSLRLAPRSSTARTTRAWALGGLRRYGEALEDADRALLHAPHEGPAHLAKARALGGLGRRQDMLDSLRRAAALDPRLVDLAEAAARLPDSADAELLFAGLPAQAAPGPRPERRADLALLLLATVAGGLLIAFGFARVLATPWGERLTGRFKPREQPEGAAPGVERKAAGAAEDGAPRRADRYELGKVIATGGMGVVYEAFDKGLKRAVAVKKMRGEIRDDPAERERFLREAHTVAALRHANIVQIHSILEEGKDIYLVFELVDGQNLKELLASRGKLPLGETLAILSGVASALDYAHGRGIVHRDLKPSNIMVAKDGQALVMDFGVARQAKDALVKAAVTNTVLGTPSYMAPEAESGIVRKESDLYSLGICLYELLTGRLPFPGGGSAQWAAKLAGRFEPPSKVAALPKGLDAVLARALAPEPEDRFPSAASLREALARL